MITNKIIVLEDKLEEMIQDLPLMAYDDKSKSYPVIFGAGDDKELGAFLKIRKNTSPYPLIWLLYPTPENHTKTKLNVENAQFILAVPTKAELRNPERRKTTYKNVLNPLLENFILLFRRANIISFEGNFTAVKHPNYSSDENGDEHIAGVIWDAYRVDVSFSVIDTCYRKVNFK